MRTREVWGSLETWRDPVPRRRSTPPCQLRWWSRAPRHWASPWAGGDTEPPGTGWSCPGRGRDTSAQSPSCRRRTCGAGRWGHLPRGAPSACPPSWWPAWAGPCLWCSTPASLWTRSGWSRHEPEEESWIMGHISNSTLNCSPSVSSSARRWMVKLPHWVELAWNLPPSTWRYRVLRGGNQAFRINISMKQDKLF